MVRREERAEDGSSDDEVLPRGFPKSNHGKEPMELKDDFSEEALRHCPNKSGRPKKQRYRSLKEIYASLDAKHSEEMRSDDGELKCKDDFPPVEPAVPNK